MSQIRTNLINVITSLPYDLDKEILKRDTKEILQEIAQKYVDMYGISDLSENDKECMEEFNKEMEALNESYINTNVNTIYNSIYNLFFFRKLKESEENIKNGKTCTLLELKQHIENLEANYANNNIR